MRFIIFTFTIFSSFAFVTDTDEELNVSFERNWNFSPSVEIISNQEIEFLNASHTKELFNTSAGTWVSRGSGQESLISIRSPVLTGSGACGSFLILEDGLPIRPAGFCNVNYLFEIASNLATNVEILKGPASSRYGGNALHGTINFISSAVSENNFVRTEINTEESFKASFQYQESQNWIMGISLNKDNSFREQSGFDQQKLNFKINKQISNWQSITYLNVTNLNQETAGYASSYKSNLRKSNANPEAYRDSSSFRIYSSLSKNEKALFFTLRPFFRFSKMDFLQHYLPGKPEEKNSQTSFGFNFSLDVNTFSNHELIFGTNFEMAKIELEEFQANELTTSSAFNNAVRPQGMHYDFKVNTNLLAAFLSHEYVTNDAFKIFSNLRIERLSYDYDNLMLDGRTKDDGTKCSFGGCYYSRPADTKTSYSDSSIRFGFSKKINTNEFFMQFSKGFRPPQITEQFRLQKSQKLADLNSERINSFELGLITNGSNFTNKAVLFFSKKNNYIYKDSDASTIADGKSKHQGIEISGSVRASSILVIKYAWSISQHLYDYSLPSIGVRKGNYIDTAPKLFGSLFFTFNPIDKLTLQIEEEYMGKYFTDPANDYSYPGHLLTNFRGFYNLTPKLDINFSLMNVFNKRYAERADYSSFSGERYFPGLPIQWRLGLNYLF